MLIECPKHGIVEHILLKNGTYKCTECRKEAVLDIRRRNKIKLVEYKGGKCEICGYNKCIDALEFHHLDPSKKEFGISCGKTVGFEKLKKEADKCILVCANCHREIHYKEKEENLKNKKDEENRQQEQFYAENKNKRKNKTYVNNLDIEKIKIDINNNITKKEIAKKYLIGLTTLKRLLKKNNIIYDEGKNQNSLSNLTIEDFVKSFAELKTFVKVGEKYNVTDKAIQKWCIRKGIPHRKSELEKYIQDNFGIS